MKSHLKKLRMKIIAFVNQFKNEKEVEELTVSKNTEDIEEDWYLDVGATSNRDLFQHKVPN